ncbi:hypothetical protein FSPOR_742, partial [Fusarium sporotrichioides]
MKPTMFLSLIAFPFALAAGTNNKAEAPSPDISVSMANFRSVFESESTLTSPRNTRRVNKLVSRKCKDLKGWKYCRMSLEL